MVSVRNLLSLALCCLTIAILYLSSAVLSTWNRYPDFLKTLNETSTPHIPRQFTYHPISTTFTTIRDSTGKPVKTKDGEYKVKYSADSTSSSQEEVSESDLEFKPYLPSPAAALFQSKITDANDFTLTESQDEESDSYSSRSGKVSSPIDDMDTKLEKDAQSNEITTVVDNADEDLITEDSVYSFLKSTVIFPPEFPYRFMSKIVFPAVDDDEDADDGSMESMSSGKTEEDNSFDELYDYTADEHVNISKAKSPLDSLELEESPSDQADIEDQGRLLFESLVSVLYNAETQEASSSLADINQCRLIFKYLVFALQNSETNEASSHQVDIEDNGRIICETLVSVLQNSDTTEASLNNADIEDQGRIICEYFVSVLQNIETKQASSHQADIVDQCRVLFESVVPVFQNAELQKASSNFDDIEDQGRLIFESLLSTLQNAETDKVSSNNLADTVDQDRLIFKYLFSALQNSENNEVSSNQAEIEDQSRLIFESLVSDNQNAEIKEDSSPQSSNNINDISDSKDNLSDNVEILVSRVSFGQKDNDSNGIYDDNYLYFQLAVFQRRTLKSLQEVYDCMFYLMICVCLMLLILISIIAFAHMALKFVEKPTPDFVNRNKEIENMEKC